MIEPPCTPPASTFVIRFWREWSAAAGRWRGRIEHVQSGQRAEFVGLEGILEFVRGCGVMAEDAASHVTSVMCHGDSASSDATDVAQAE
ncbi:MAG: hypothetical protein JXA78_15275 [Anaerolineales bacterium]|nr:hypothetical protein [Anaerolineales bacterium]